MSVVLTGSHGTAESSGGDIHRHDEGLGLLALYLFCFLVHEDVHVLVLEGTHGEPGNVGGVEVECHSHHTADETFFGVAGDGREETGTYHMGTDDVEDTHVEHTVAFDGDVVGVGLHGIEYVEDEMLCLTVLFDAEGDNPSGVVYIYLLGGVEGVLAVPLLLEGGVEHGDVGGVLLCLGEFDDGDEGDVVAVGGCGRPHHAVVVVGVGEVVHGVEFVPHKAHAVHVDDIFQDERPLIAAAVDQQGGGAGTLHHAGEVLGTRGQGELECTHGHEVAVEVHHLPVAVADKDVGAFLALRNPAVEAVVHAQIVAVVNHFGVGMFAFLTDLVDEFLCAGTAEARCCEGEQCQYLLHRNIYLFYIYSVRYFLPRRMKGIMTSSIDTPPCWKVSV